MIQFGWVEYDFLAFSISHNLWFWSITLYSHMWHYVISQVWRNLHSDRNSQKSELWRIAEIRGRPEKFHFQRRGTRPMGGGWFSKRRFIPLCIHTVKQQNTSQYITLEPKLNIFLRHYIWPSVARMSRSKLLCF